MRCTGCKEGIKHMLEVHFGLKSLLGSNEAGGVKRKIRLRISNLEHNQTIYFQSGSNVKMKAVLYGDESGRSAKISREWV